ncbi:class I SAM-dependent methyltransferase [Brevibacillus panacihumi]|uniref:class I SAM-dependent methyltransferase n=1 Tax=Brevibacillus panacihumi TaxID=497735 RepID=UPI003D092994
MGLIEWIREEINSAPTQAIPFARYMELALYHPVWGYYMTDRQKVGRQGDFYTSAAVHPVFAETLADVVAAMCRAGEFAKPHLVEIGGGPGSLCRFLLDRLRESAPELYQRIRVVMIETSPYHRAMQQESLRDHEVEKVWYDSLGEAARETNGITGVVLSNEWLDAFPVHIVEKQAGGWREVWVASNDEGFVETYRDPTPALAGYLKSMEEEVEVPRGVRIEVNLAMDQAARDVAQLLDAGYVITIDYGDLQEELYHPSRKKGTLMCYHRHQAHDDPYQHVGEQDLTCHVNFSQWMKSGEENGLRVLDYLRQDQFLMRCGLLQKAVAHADRDPFTSQAMKRNRAIVQLLDPAGLGGRFRVVVQGKNVRQDTRFYPIN